jgi:hypothetical protein
MTARIAKLAREDRLSSSEDELMTFKWSTASGMASFTKLFLLGLIHPSKNKFSGNARDRVIFPSVKSYRKSKLPHVNG